MSDEEQANGRDPKTGRFRKGQSGCPSGRPKGVVAVSRATNLRDTILAAAERAGQAVNMGPKSDDGVAAYLEWLATKEPRSFAGLLGKILPLMPTRLQLPAISKPEDLVAASAAIAKAVSEGELAPNEGSAIASIVGTVGKAIEVHALEARLQALEQRLDEKGNGR